MKQIEKAMHGGGKSRAIAKQFRFGSEVIAILVMRGWSLPFVTRIFRSLDDRDVGSHIPISFVEEWAKYRASLARGTFATVLRQIGVRPSIVSILERRIYTPLVNTCYSEPQLVDIAIEYLLRRRVPITKHDPLATMTHPFSPDILCRWFAPPEEIILESSFTPATLLFQNLPFRCSQYEERAVQAALAALPTHNPDTHVLHYHTTSWGGCMSIIEKTINNREGRICLDFGLEPAFYLSQKIQDALGWGYLQGRTDDKVAILVFSLPKVATDTPLRIKHLRGEEWTRVTGESRRCRRPYAHPSERRYYELPEIRGIDFLYGNMVANVADIHSHGADPIPHDPPKTQLASKTARGDIFLQQHLVGCLFFQKHIAAGRENTTPRSTNRTRRRR